MRNRGRISHLQIFTRLAAVVCATLAAAAAARLNVVMIAVDDLRPEMGVYGGRALTPRIDAFAQSAVTFNRNYVQIGVCSPSRTSLLTSRYPDSTRITDLWHYFRDVGANSTTIPEAFRVAGYRVVGSSKIFHPGHASGAGDDWSSYNPCGAGCEGFNDPLSWNAYYEPTSNAVPPWSYVDNHSWYALDEATYPRAMHPDAQSAAFAANAIASASAAGEPFFVAAGFLKPHLPFIFPAPFLEPYANYSELAPDAAAADGEAPASWTGWSELRSYADIAPIAARLNLSAPGAQMPRAKALELRRGYYAATSFTDYCVGLVLDAIVAAGRADDTVVALFGDHGWQLGDHADWAKHTNFESVVRAPLIIRSPAHAASAGALVQAITSHIDLGPTLCALAGVAPPATFQGLTLEPLLADPALAELPGRAFSYAQYPREVTPCPPPATDCGWPHAMGYTIRTPAWRYTEWVQYDNETFRPHWATPFRGPVWRELYSHAGDTGPNWELFERSNVVDDPAHAAVVANLSALLHSGPGLLASRG